MSDENRTPYADDALQVVNGTKPEDIREFVERRAMNPHQFGDVTVWNLNNHELDKEQLASQVDEFYHDEYLIPYQASGAFGYMLSLLPERMRKAEILTYRQKTGEYLPYPNYIRHADEELDDELREKIKSQLGDDGI